MLVLLDLWIKMWRGKITEVYSLLKICAKILIRYRNEERKGMQIVRCKIWKTYEISKTGRQTFLWHKNLNAQMKRSLWILNIMSNFGKDNAKTWKLTTRRRIKPRSCSTQNPMIPPGRTVYVQWLARLYTTVELWNIIWRRQTVISAFRHAPWQNLYCFELLTPTQPSATSTDTHLETASSGALSQFQGNRCASQSLSTRMRNIRVLAFVFTVLCPSR